MEAFLFRSKVRLSRVSILNWCHLFIVYITGTAVSVFGSNTGQLENGPNWECFIDGDSIGRTQFTDISAQNNWPFCEKAGLSDGQHQVTVNVTASGEQTFLFDYFRYAPSASVSDDNAFIMIQNEDPALVYDNSWREGADDFGNLRISYDMTTTRGAKVSFNFTGAFFYPCAST
jgi:hypothetical protein